MEVQSRGVPGDARVVGFGECCDQCPRSPIRGFGAPKAVLNGGQNGSVKHICSDFILRVLAATNRPCVMCTLEDVPDGKWSIRLPVQKLVFSVPTPALRCPALGFVCGASGQLLEDYSPCLPVSYLSEKAWWVLNCARNLLLEYLDAKNTSGVEPGSCLQYTQKKKRAKALIINGVGKALKSVTKERDQGE